MAITKLNSLAIPPNTIVESDLSYPLTNFSSTGIDDNASSTAVTIDASQNVSLSGDLTVINSATDATASVVATTNADATLNLLESGAGDVGASFVYDGGDNKLYIKTGNNPPVTRMTINRDNGNVGIGKTPTETLNLEVQAPTGYSVVSGFYSGSSQATATFRDANTTAQFKVRIGSEGDDLLLFAGGSERMRIDSSGNVGIGTSSPTALIHLNGAGGAVEMKQTATTGRCGLVMQQTAGNFYIAADNSSGSGYAKGAYSRNIYSTGAYPMIFWTAGVERMRIDDSGNLLVGATSATGFSGKVVITDGAVGGTTYLDICNGSNDNQFLKLGIANNLGIIGYDDGDGLAFGQFTNAGGTGFSSEHMRLDSSGNLLLNRTAAPTTSSANDFGWRPDLGTLYLNCESATGPLIVNQSYADTATRYQIRFYRNETQVGYIQSSTTATSYITTSDERLKENITDAPAGNIDDIRICSFDWKADGSHQTYGVIAQELIAVAPEAVSQGETDEDMWGVDYSKLVPMMIKEIQDLRARVAQLEGA